MILSSLKLKVIKNLLDFFPLFFFLCFFTNGSKIWNKLSLDLRQAKSLKIFQNILLSIAPLPSCFQFCCVLVFDGNKEKI